MIDYILQLLIWLDQGLNVILGGKSDETLSSRAYRADRGGKAFGIFFRPMIDAIFFWEKDHCRMAYLAEINRKQLPDDFLKWMNE